MAAGLKRGALAGLARRAAPLLLLLLLLALSAWRVALAPLHRGVVTLLPSPSAARAVAPAAGQGRLPASALAGRVTLLVVAASARPECALRLLQAAGESFPGIAAVVLDASEAPLLRGEALEQLRSTLSLTYVRAEPGVGPAEARNRLVARAQTPYVLLLGDELALPSALGLEGLLPALEAGALDVAGGCREGGAAWSRSLARDGGVLTQSALQACSAAHLVPAAAALPADYSVLAAAACWRADLVHGFFLARTAALRSVPWDAQLGAGVWEDFFLRAREAGVRVGACLGVNAPADVFCSAASLSNSSSSSSSSSSPEPGDWVALFRKHGLHRAHAAAGQYDLLCQCQPPGSRPLALPPAALAELLAEEPAARAALQAQRDSAPAHRDLLLLLTDLAAIVEALGGASEAEALYREALQ